MPSSEEEREGVRSPFSEERGVGVKTLSCLLDAGVEKGLRPELSCEPC